jgi:hypothetical protein
MSWSLGAKLGTFLTLGGKTRAHLLWYVGIHGVRARALKLRFLNTSLATYFKQFLKQYGNYLG